MGEKKRYRGADGRIMLGTPYNGMGGSESKEIPTQNYIYPPSLSKARLKSILSFCQYPFLKIIFTLKKSSLLLGRYIYAMTFCKLGLHVWVGVSKRRIGFCHCCQNFYEVGKGGLVKSRVTSLNRTMRRRMEKGLCR